MNKLTRPIEDLASFVRDLGSECTNLNLNDNYLIAGSKLGKLKQWDLETGQTKWSLDVEGPISDSEIGDKIYVTASAELHSINIETGFVEWSKDIEGSSDLVEVDNDSIFVTSSLYEIDIQDYTETTLLEFNKDGKLLKKINFEEKPWFMKRQENKTILGIGRPRCGLLTVDEQYTISHYKAEEDSPVNMGFKTDTGYILGHSNGGITKVDGEKREHIKCGNQSISAIFSNNGSWKVGDSSGKLFSSNGWIVEFDNKISCIIETENFIWVAVTSLETKLYLLDKENGSIKHQFLHNKKIQIMKLSGYNLALSDEEGTVMFIDLGTLHKRFQYDEKIDQDIGRRNLLKKRLRALRGQ